MAAAVLQRELDAYNDALAYYQRGVQNYNVKADTFNESFLKDSAGNKYIYQKPYTDVGINYVPIYGPDGSFMGYDIQYIPIETGNKYYVADASGKLTETSKPGGTYGLTDLEGNFQTLRINPDAQGAYPTQPPAWTKTFDQKAPEGTTSQVKKLDQPSLTDVERNTPSGLISSAFNF